MSDIGKTNIYILRLENGKYYIGKSDDPMKRYDEHIKGRGSSWTKCYKPIGLVKIIPNVSSFEEDKITKEYMLKYGIKNVRGGSYVSHELDDIQQEALRREIWGAKDCCTICGRKGHFAKNCYAKTDIEGNELVYEEEVEEYTYYKAKGSYSCYRCGRTGHYSSECYAIKDKYGSYLDDSDEDY
jgi:predicted GIY-YIG superfamily endonuclease